MNIYKLEIETKVSGAGSKTVYPDGFLDYIQRVKYLPLWQNNEIVIYAAVDSEYGELITAEQAQEIVDANAVVEIRDEYDADGNSMGKVNIGTGVNIAAVLNGKQ